MTLTRPDDPRGAHKADERATQALTMALLALIAAVIALVWILAGPHGS